MAGFDLNTMNANSMGQMLFLMQFGLVKYEWAAATVIYVGCAVPGTADAEAFWAIRRFTLDAVTFDLDEEWAEGEFAFDKAWSLRATYAYS